jgi:protein TonB
LLFSAGLALILHALLFSMKTEWMKKKSYDFGKPEPITLSMAYKKVQPQVPSPAKTAMAPKQGPQPIKEPPEKKAAESNPVKAKPAKKRRPLKKLKKMIAKPKVLPKPEDKLQMAPAPKPTSRSQPQPVLKQESLSSPKEPAALASLSPREVPAKEAALPKTEEVAPQHAHPALTEAIPVYRKNPPPKYPRIARRRGYEGTVVMEVLVNRKGRVQAVRVHDSSGHTVLDKAAMTSVKKWLFEPGRRGKEKVDMWVKVPIRFRLK